MIYRISFIFEGQGVGWAETHAMANASTNPATLAPTLSDIAAKRVQMLGREFWIKMIRVSRYALEDGTRQRGVFPIKQIWRNSVQTQSAAAEPAAVALLTTGFASPSLVNPQFDTNTNHSFLGAPLDASVDDAGTVYPGKGGLGAAFAAWKSVMVNGNLGWLGNQTIANVGITSIAQNVNGTVTFTMDAGDIAGLTLGQVYKVRVRGVNNGLSPLNIEMSVRKASVTTLVSQRVIGIPTPQTNGSMRVYKQVQPFIDYGDIILQDTVGKHKRGRPIGTSPGRRRKQILG